jgi:AraC-like DNA-binding protein
MPLFMDFHEIENITVEDVLKAHMADLSVQEKYGVKYHQFWVNQKAGTVFCLTEGPDAKTCEMVHQIAHGNMACAITEVESGTYKLYMGEHQHVDHGLVKNEDGTVDLGYRNILVASVRAMTISVSSSEGRVLQVPHWAKTVVSENISKFHGRDLKWDIDDSLIGVFNDATDSVECAQHIQTALSANDQHPKVVFKIGLGADQPLNKEGEFFAKAIKLAHHLSTTAGNNQVWISSLVKRLCQKEVSATSSFKCLDAPEEDFISNLIDIAYRNLANNDLTIDHICKDVGISRPQLYRKITSLTGKPPNDFLRDLRLEQALTLLKKKSGNVSQVAMDVGFNSPSYFAKCFADKFGCTPSQAFA